MMLIIIGYSALILLFYLIIAFIIGTLKKNNGLMDVFYGPGYFVMVLTSLILNIILNNEVDLRQIIVTILVFIWATRLATYVFTRNRGKPEDYRYQAMRKRWGNKVVLKSFYRIYIFQGIVIFIVSFPAWFINISSNPSIESALDFYGVTLWLGAIVWVIGFLFEKIECIMVDRFIQP